MRQLFLLFLFLPFLLMAQTRSGPRAGLAMATISSGQLLEWNGLPKLGPILGWSWDVSWTRQASFLIEPMYMSKGSLVQNPQLDQWTATRYGYLEMPVLIKFSLDTLPRGLFLDAGFIGGYWLNGRQTTKQDGVILTEINYDLSSTTDRGEFSVAVGMGVDKTNLSFEVRAQTSITPFDPVYRAQNLVVGLHFTYYLPKKGTVKKKKAEEEEEVN